MNITVKDVPSDLHKRLKSVADETGRSINKMIIFTLERALTPQKVDREALVRRIRSRRDRMEPILDDAGLQDAINVDRE